MRAWLPALLLLGGLLAGCSSPEQDTLRAIYGTDFQSSLPSGFPSSIKGAHIEALVGSTWEKRASLLVEMPPFASPSMASPAPNGGGGERTQLALLNATLDLRLAEFARLGGLIVEWTVSNQVVGVYEKTLPGDQVLHARLSLPGPFAVSARILTSSVDNQTQALFAEPFEGNLAGHWTIMGTVQPQSPPTTPAGPPPQRTPRDQMVDVYYLLLDPGANITAKTSWGGTSQAQGGGTDVDLGVYALDPVLCSSTGGGQLPVVGGGNPVPDPAQSDESLQVPVPTSGIWSIEVGAQQDGCPLKDGGGTGAYYYTNSGPVPYKLDLTIG